MQRMHRFEKQKSKEQMFNRKSAKALDGGYGWLSMHFQRRRLDEWLHINGGDVHYRQYISRLFNRVNINIAMCRSGPMSCPKMQYHSNVAASS